MNMFTKSGKSWKMPEHQEPYTRRNMYLRSDIGFILTNDTSCCLYGNDGTSQYSPKVLEYLKSTVRKVRLYLCTKYRYYALASTCEVQYLYYLRTVMFRQEEYLKTTTRSTVRNDTYLPRRSVVPVVYEILICRDGHDYQSFMGYC